MGSTTEKIFLDIQVKGDKQLAQANELMSELAKKIGNFKKEGKAVVDLESDLNRLIDVTNELKKAKENEAKDTLAFGIKKLKFSSLELQKQKELLAQEKLAQKEKEKLSAQEHRDRQKKLNDAKKIEDALKDEQQILNRQAKSYEDLAKLTSLLTKQRKQLNLTTEEGQKEFLRLGEIIEKNNAQLKSFDASVGNFQRNVGDYKNQLAELVPGIGAIDGAFTKLLANPIIAILSGLVIILGTLGKAFMSTADGMSITNKIAANLGAAMRTLETFTITLYDAITSLSDSAIGKGLNKALEVGGKAIDIYITAWKGLVKAIAPDTYEAVAKAAEKANEQFIKTAKLLELANLQRTANAQTNRIVGIEIENLITKEEKLRELAGSSLTTDAKKIELSKEANKVTLERLNLQEQLIKNELAVVRTEQKAAGDNFALKQELADKEFELQKELIGVRRVSALLIMQSDRESGEARRDQAERELDILIDLLDAEKTINEKRALADGVPLAEREKLLAKNKEITERAYREQINVASEFAGQKLNLDELVNESDAVVLRDKIKAITADDIIAGRIVEIVKERKIVLQDLADFQSAIIKKDLDEKKAKQDADDKLADDKLKKEIENFDKSQAIAAEKFKSTKPKAEDLANFAIKQEAEKLAKMLELNLLYNQAISEQDKKLTQAKIDNLKKQVEDVELTEEQKKEIVDSAISVGQEVLGFISEGNNLRLEKDLAALQERYDKGLISEKDFNTKSEKLKKDAARKDQNIALGQAFIEAAILTIRALAQPPAPNFILAGLAAVAGGIQIASIKSQKFADGGVLPSAKGGITRGRSHAQGGVKIPNLNSEIEGGEIVLTKAVTSNPRAFALADMANQMVGGAALSSGRTNYFASGGILPSQDFGSKNTMQIVEKQVPILVLDSVLDATRSRAQEVRIQEGQ